MGAFCAFSGGERIFPSTSNLFHLWQCQFLDFPICLKTAAACMSSCTSTNDSSSQHCHQIEYQGNHVNKQRNRSHLCSNAWHFLNMEQTVWGVFSGSFGQWCLVQIVIMWGDWARIYFSITFDCQRVWIAWLMIFSYYCGVYQNMRKNVFMSLLPKFYFLFLDTKWDKDWVCRQRHTFWGFWESNWSKDFWELPLQLQGEENVKRTGGIAPPPWERTCIANSAQTEYCITFLC